jgi:tripartite-type tricarboxylate transporter receptor subunit TctC
MKMSRIWIVLMAILAIVALNTPVSAQEKFPTKPITLEVGYGAGGSTDLPARALAEAAGRILGQPVVVVNKPGGGSSVMLSELKTAKPDGYTLGVLSTGGILSAHMRKVPYHPINDFDCILQYSVYQYGLVVKADSPFKTLKDLISYAQANPGKIKYSTSGAGTPQHLVMVQLGEATKAKWIHIPFGGGNEAITALLGGHVDCSAQTTEWKAQVDAGRLRLLAILMNQRMADYPNVPTLMELGYNIAAPSIIGLVAPKGLTKDRLKILHDAFYKAMQDPGFKKSLAQFDLPVVYRNSEDCAKLSKELYESSGKLIEKLEKKN